MNSKQINGSRLRMARIINGYSSPALAGSIGVSKQAIWQYENNEVRQPDPTIIFNICKALDFPYRFFFEGHDQTVEEGNSFYRTSTSTTKSEKEKQQQLNILRTYLRNFFSLYVEFPEFDSPVFKFADFDLNMEAYTVALREYYALDLTPIENMANFIENIGIPLSTFSYTESKFDAISQMPEINKKKYRVIAYNIENTTFARIQFTLAHELGHWLLGHLDSDESTLTKMDYADNEKEANLFASHFLLPKEEFIVDLHNPLDLNLYVDLKRKWKVSIAMMIMRAHNLKLISATEYQNLYRQLSRRGWRTSEPYDDLAIIPKPVLLSQTVELLNEHGIIRKLELIDFLTNNSFTAHQHLYESLLEISEGALNKRAPISPVVKLLDHKESMSIIEKEKLT